MWSESLKEQTREFLQQYQRGMMKHFGDSRYGICLVSENSFEIFDRKTKEVESFNSIEELLAGGWAID